MAPAAGAVIDHGEAAAGELGRADKRAADIFAGLGGGECQPAFGGQHPAHAVLFGTLKLKNTRNEQIFSALPAITETSSATVWLDLVQAERSVSIPSPSGRALCPPPLSRLARSCDLLSGRKLDILSMNGRLAPEAAGWPNINAAGLARLGRCGRAMSVVGGQNGKHVLAASISDFDP